MKALIINRNYFITGGPEKYMFALEEEMADCELVPFAVNFSKNRPTQYSRYFVNSPFGDNEAYFRGLKKNVFSKMRYALNSIYSIEARRKMTGLIREVRPDAAIFLNAHFFSQSIIDACCKMKVPIIMRMSDFHLVCGSYLLSRNQTPCTECLDKGLTHLLRNRCGGYQQSISAAIIRFAGMTIARWRRVYDYISYFVCPSVFTCEILIRAGFSKEKVIYVPTFVKTQVLSALPSGASSRILYVGRLSPEKGVEIFLDALRWLRKNNWVAVIAGDTSSDYAKRLIDSIPKQLKQRILFTGFIKTDAVKEEIRKCQFMVVPSLWYENLPNTALEAMSHGRAVVASRLGSLSEIVQDNETGMLFSAGNHKDLAEKMQFLLDFPNRAADMGEKAYQYVSKHHNAASHIQKIKSLLKSIAK